MGKDLDTIHLISKTPIPFNQEKQRIETLLGWVMYTQNSTRERYNQMSYSYFEITTEKKSSVRIPIKSKASHHDSLPLQKIEKQKAPFPCILIFLGDSGDSHTPYHTPKTFWRLLTSFSLCNGRQKSLLNRFNFTMQNTLSLSIRPNH